MMTEQVPHEEDRSDLSDRDDLSDHDDHDKNEVYPEIDENHKMIELIKNEASIYTKFYWPTVERVRSVENDGNFDKFGGMPSFEKNQKINWPRCKTCDTPLQFFFQLTDPFKQKTFQVFNCLEDLHDTRISYIDYKK